MGKKEAATATIVLTELVPNLAQLGSYRNKPLFYHNIVIFWATEGTVYTGRRASNDLTSTLLSNQSNGVLIPQNAFGNRFGMVKERSA